MIPVRDLNLQQPLWFPDWISVGRFPAVGLFFSIFAPRLINAAWLQVQAVPVGKLCRHNRIRPPLNLKQRCTCSGGRVKISHSWAAALKDREMAGKMTRDAEVFFFIYNRTAPETSSGNMQDFESGQTKTRQYDSVAAWMKYDSVWWVTGVNTPEEQADGEAFYLRPRCFPPGGTDWPEETEHLQMCSGQPQDWTNCWKLKAEGFRQKTHQHQWVLLSIHLKLWMWPKTIIGLRAEKMWYFLNI